MKKQYQYEIDGQKDFYYRIGLDPKMSDYTDGIDKGTLYENKLDISNINETLFQAIKYLSRIRIKGNKLPSQIFLNDLNRETVYIFYSKDFLTEIEKIYFGPASKNNQNFSTNISPIKIVYSTSKGLEKLLRYVNNESYVKYHVDQSNIVGLAHKYYEKNMSKDDFLKGKNAEIRRPKILSDRIIPYKKKDNLEFEDIMDLLNTQLLQREQGAFYTPPAYVKKMHEYLYRAIREIPKGNDYVIIDRCAGTGNLIEDLPKDILSHCILSTIENNEYAILNYKYGDLCSVVIPNTDALQYKIIPAEHNTQGIINDYVKDKVNDEKCSIILLENPPFSEAAAGSIQKTGKKRNLWKQSLVCKEMKKEVKGVITNDISNLFIWSGFKYYLKQPHDSYILFSPTKYWRNHNLVNKKFRSGFLCDRREFHTTDASALACIWWQNISDFKTESLKLTPYDIIGKSVIRACKDITIKKAYKTLASGFDKREFKNDEFNGIICERNGQECVNKKKKNYGKPLYNKNIIGYITASNFQIDRKDVLLTRCCNYKAHGFFLRNDNFLLKLPIFVAASFPYNKWYRSNVYSKSYDGNERHLKDLSFLKTCFIYTVLTQKNKCLSMLGSDGRFYNNELTLDGNTVSCEKLSEFKNLGMLTKYENKLLKYWNDVLYEAKQTEEYNILINKFPKITLGVWQIKEQINIKIPSGRLNKKGEPIMVFKYVELNTELKKLDYAVKQYFSDIIEPKLFKYQLIK